MCIDADIHGKGSRCVREVPMRMSVPVPRSMMGAIPDAHGIVTDHDGVSPRIRKRSLLITRRFESESSSSSPKRSGGLSSEDMPEILLRIRRCNTCESIFCVCSHCDRGQRYCSDLCRKQARQEQRRAANRRHQQTAFGREAHKLRQRAYRRRQCGPRVTDQGYRLVILGNEWLAQPTPSS
jgi:hypothetical protein